MSRRVYRFGQLKRIVKHRLDHHLNWVGGTHAAPPRSKPVLKGFVNNGSIFGFGIPRPGILPFKTTSRLCRPSRNDLTLWITSDRRRLVS
jgi:hypothetical protein